MRRPQIHLNFGQKKDWTRGAAAKPDKIRTVKQFLLHAAINAAKKHLPAATVYVPEERGMARNRRESTGFDLVCLEQLKEPPFLQKRKGSSVKGDFSSREKSDLLLCAFLTQAKYCERIILHFDAGTAHNKRFQLFRSDRQTDDSAAVAAEHMLVTAQLPIKTISLSRDGHPAHLTDSDQGVQITVDGAKAETRANGPQGSTDLFCSGMVGAGKHLFQNQFSLM